MAGYVPFENLSLAIGEVIFDLFDVYGGVFRDEATWLSKHDTLKWLILDHWTNATAVSIARHVTRFALRSLAVHFPDSPDWFLPDLDGEKAIWPLAKVMRWIYSKTDVSQTQFHYPMRDAHGMLHGLSMLAETVATQSTPAPGHEPVAYRGRAGRRDV